MKKLAIFTSIDKQYEDKFDYLMKHPQDSNFSIFDFDEETFNSILNYCYNILGNCNNQFDDIDNGEGELIEEFPHIDPNILKELYWNYVGGLYFYVIYLDTTENCEKLIKAIDIMNEAAATDVWNGDLLADLKSIEKKKLEEFFNQF